MKALQHFKRAVQRRWNDRKSFSSTGSWLLSLYDASVRYAGNRVPMPLKGSVRPLKFRQAGAPVYVRIGTSDAAMAEEIFVRDVYAQVTPQLFRESVRLIVDLGANCGMTIRLWASRFPDARVIAVEPDASNIAVARKNTGTANATLVESCIAGTPGRVNLSATDAECAYHIDRSGAETGRWVEAITMDQLLATHTAKDESIDLLKCDIEGAEEEVFRDCRSWIGRVRNLVIELHGKYDKDRFLDDLKRNDSTLVVVHSEILYGNAVLTLSQQPN